LAQTKKDDIRARLHAAAKDEFLKHGFGGANLRSIAKSSNVSLANIYSYAKDKDDLFRSILSGVVSDFDGLGKRFRTYDQEAKKFDPLEVEQERLTFAVPYVHKNRVELNLLLNLSNGSSLENYSEWIVESYADNCKRFLAHLKKQKSLTFVTPSDFFFKSVARFALKAIAEATKKNLSQRAMAKIADEITRYNFYGFRGVAQVNDKKTN
jgi:AcrR family transcriptional regulator